MALTGACLTASVVPGQPWWAVFTWLCLTGFFAFSWCSPFWVLPTLTLSSSAAAVSIGFINMCANLAGLLGSPVVGGMKRAGYGDAACLLFLAFCYVGGGAVVAVLRVPRPAGAVPSWFRLPPGPAQRTLLDPSGKEVEDRLVTDRQRASPLTPDPPIRGGGERDGG
jgi:hypothetical protein